MEARARRDILQQWATRWWLACCRRGKFVAARHYFLETLPTRFLDRMAAGFERRERFGSSRTITLANLKSHLEWGLRVHSGSRRLGGGRNRSSRHRTALPRRRASRIQLKKRFDVLRLLDEAHAIGVVGADGRGGWPRSLGGNAGRPANGDAWKIVRREWRQHWRDPHPIHRLINRARSFVFSTCRPRRWRPRDRGDRFPRFRRGETCRRILWERIVQLAKCCPMAAPPSAAGGRDHPVDRGRRAAGARLAQTLQREGFLVPAIRYPTVAKGAARLRISLSASHSEAQVASLGEALTRLAATGYGPEMAKSRRSGVGM